MRNTILIATVVVMWLSFVSAQTKPLPPTTIAGAGFASRTQGSLSRMPSLSVGTSRTNLFFCPRGQCLYYAGDCDSTSPNSNGVFDFDNPGIGISDAEVWVGVKPTKNAVITGASGNYWTTAGGIGTNPTPFAVRTGISPGSGGELVCSTSGNAVFGGYYMSECTLELGPYNYYIPKLAKACRVKAEKTYYIDLTPQYNDGSTFGYLADDDGRRAHKRGWPEVKDKSYFNSSSFGVDYQPTWGGSGACGGIGCDGFSISLTGREK